MNYIITICLWAMIAVLGLPILFIVAMRLLGQRTPDVLKRLSCRMTWHSCAVGYDTTGFDGCSFHAQCKWCDFKGLVDSQGNLF